MFSQVNSLLFQTNL